MNKNLQPLKEALQMLALPVAAQVRLDVVDCGRVERLSQKFRDGQRYVRAELNDQLTLEQKGLLLRIDGLLFLMNSGCCWLNWPEKRMRQDANWRQVRAYARAALVNFNWQLDLPAGSVSRSPQLHNSATWALPICMQPEAC